MSTMIVEVYDALIEAGASEEKAKAASQVIPDIRNLATKTDMQKLQSEIQELRLETRAELKVLKFAVFSLYPFVLAIAYRIFS